jgi:methyltransferase (TIGR00027 family)
MTLASSATPDPNSKGTSAVATSVRAREKNEVIRTAEGACLARAAASREPDPMVANPDYLAKHFLGPWYRFLVEVTPVGLSRVLFERKLPGGYGGQTARTRYFDRVLHETLEGGAKQLVLLGAGYDTRPYRLRGRLDGIGVFELDLPGTQGRKKARLRRLFGELPSHVTYVPIDFARQSLADVLLPAGYDPSLRTHFHWEGVTYYVDEPAVSSVLSFVHRQSALGSTVTFDYWLRSFVEGDLSPFGGKKLVQYAVTELGEPFLFGLNDDDIVPFMGARGFEVVSDLGPAELIAQYLTRADGTLLGRPWGFMRVALARTV